MKNLKKEYHPHCRAVVQFTLEGQFVKEYPSQLEAAEVSNSNQSDISKVCRGVWRTAKVFHSQKRYVWKFKKPPNKRRPIRTIAIEIADDWRPVHYAAKPYLTAMHLIEHLDEAYWNEHGASVVRYFLANAQTWRGEIARRVKKELNEMLRNK